jgi:hypothetical protein
MYELLVHDTVKNFEERAEAVKAAKELTARLDGPSTSTVTDGIETLSFREGKLVAYTYETRRTDVKRRSSEPREGSAPAAAPAKAVEEKAAPSAETETVTETETTEAEATPAAE